jgi:hypothetical protein
MYRADMDCNPVKEITGLSYASTKIMKKEDGTAEGKKYPFFNHNGNYQVDLAAIPLETLIGATGLLEMFKK